MIIIYFLQIIFVLQTRGAEMENDLRKERLLK